MAFNMQRLSDRAVQMLCFNVFWILVLTIWGLVGIHTDRFGFKHVWEIWYENFPPPLPRRVIGRSELWGCADA